MGDVGDAFKDWKEYSKDKREKNRNSSADYLTNHGIEYVSKSGGVHLIISAGEYMIDFWPGTGKWMVRRGKTSRGVKRLVELVKQLRGE